MRKSEQSEARLLDTLTEVEGDLVTTIKTKLRTANQQTKQLKFELETTRRKLTAGQAENADKLALAQSIRNQLLAGTDFPLAQRITIFQAFGPQIVTDGNSGRQFTLTAN